MKRHAVVVVGLVGLGLSCAGGPRVNSESAMTETTPRARYDAWLGDRAGGGEVLAGPSFGASPYELYFVSSPVPGRKDHVAAASSASVVVPGEPAGWGAFLQSAEPSVVQSQIGWMHGAWANVSPADPATAARLAGDAKAQKYVAEPAVEVRDDGTVIYVAWFGEPPSFDPFRFRVRVNRDGTATFKTDQLWKLP